MRGLFSLVLVATGCSPIVDGRAPTSPERSPAAVPVVVPAAPQARSPEGAPAPPVRRMHDPHEGGDAVTTDPRLDEVRETARGGMADRDYAIRVGIGFRAEELLLLERAADTWRAATGLPIHLRHGYGPLGNFHIAEEIPVCGQRWVYDGFLGCYNPSSDLVVLNRHGIELEAAQMSDLLYVVLIHEMGHWLGLGHAQDGEDSVMLPDYPRVTSRPSNFSSLSRRDVDLVCAINACRDSTPDQ